MKCKHYTLCDQASHAGGHLSGHCDKCFILYSFYKNGELLFNSVDSLDTECSNCFVESLCYAMPKCSHYLCKGCFKTNYYEPIPTAPLFPHDATHELDYYIDAKMITYLNAHNNWVQTHEKINYKSQTCIVCNTNYGVGMVLTGCGILIYVYIPFLFKMLICMGVLYISIVAMVAVY